MTDKSYHRSELIKLAKRDNNKKRPFLLVNPLQGKHIPVSPEESLNLFEKLFLKLNQNYPQNKFLIIGFAETATAIGAAVSVLCPQGSYYIHTTREIVEKSEYLYFTEAHSHATEQKLVKDNLKDLISKTDRIVFVEDEITTGNTILDITKLLRKEYNNLQLNFTILSIVSGVNEESRKKLDLEKINHIYEVSFETENMEKLDNYSYDNSLCHQLEVKNDIIVEEHRITDNSNPRKGIEVNEYKKSCDFLVSEIMKKLENKNYEGKKILVLGTEEFMYPAMLLGEKIEREWSCEKVRFHATTRSPILPSSEENYPLNSRYELISLYDKDRVTYLYNLDKYDKVIIVHDSSQVEIEIGLKSLCSALVKNNCEDISIFHWGNANENFL